MDAIMEHGGITALLLLLNNGHLEAWSSATHTLHMLCSSMPAAAVMITQSGMPYCSLNDAARPAWICIILLVLSSAQLSSTQLNSIQPNPTQLNSTQFNSTQLNSTQLNSTQLNAQV